jgi:hypothetical protein
MSEHHEPEPPTTFTYAVGAGLGLLVGAGIGLFIGDSYFLAAALLGAGIGVVVAFLVRAFLR